MGLNTLSAISAVSGVGKIQIQRSPAMPDDRQLTFKPFLPGTAAAVTIILDPEAWNDLVAVITAELADAATAVGPGGCIPTF